MPKGLRGSSRTSWSKASSIEPPMPRETISSGSHAGWNIVTASVNSVPPVVRVGMPRADSGRSYPEAPPEPGTKSRTSTA